MDGHYVANDPLPPGAAPREVPALPAGRYLLSCASHPDERAVLVVVDHPFLARTDTDGRFRFDGVGGGTPVVRVEAEVSERARIDLERESR
jgi:hypothetical protein